MVKIMGIHADTSTCECCGKTGLNRVVALQFEDGSIRNYGTTCAAKAMGAKKTALDVQYDAIAYAQKWVNEGRDLNAVAKATWNKFGFSAQVKDNAIVINIGALVTVKRA